MSNPVPTKNFAERFELLKGIIQQINKDANVHSMSIGIAHEGESLANGLHFSETSVTKDTRYPINHLTQGIIAVMAGIACDQGRLDLGTPICKINQKFKFPSKFLQDNITIHELLAHCSGVKGNDMIVLGHEDWSENELFSRFASLDYNDRPEYFGRQFSHNNWGFAVIGRLLENAYGKPISVLLSEFIFQPLGMKRTNTAWIRREGSDFAIGSYSGSYSVLESGARVSAAPPHIGIGSIMESALGIKSTSADLLLFYSTMNHYMELTEKHSPQHNPDGPTKAESKRMAELGPIFKGSVGIIDWQTSHQVAMLPHVKECNSTLHRKGYLAAYMQAEGRSCEIGTHPRKSCLRRIPTWSFYEGYKTATTVAYHQSGALSGSSSVVYMFPETKTVIVVLQNTTALYDTASLVAEMIIEFLFNRTSFSSWSPNISVPKLGRALSARTVGCVPKEHPEAFTFAYDGSDYAGTYKLVSMPGQSFCITVVDLPELNRLLLRLPSPWNEDFVLAPDRLEHRIFRIDMTFNDFVRSGRSLPDPVPFGQDNSFLFIRFQVGRPKGDNGKLGDVGLDTLIWNWSGRVCGGDGVCFEKERQ
ncbi:beta-lactamase/transpeptidase-like protein [Ascobolus immersus RN42]|uniref:Beta-lactamase/transpeptidase-like protein n=1 Tax=Ascobolus immersus RN42 TaxID=1160509 RepID=A0A3N4IMY8_ASCIM|nr:beta-lactamase/transpeptidase-like protein [Ascobolus immersus RN42]